MNNQLFITILIYISKIHYSKYSTEKIGSVM